MAVTDLTSLISPGMQLAQQYQAVPQMQQQSASAAARSLQYAQAEAELQAAYDELERSSTSYNELVDSYNTAESAAEQAIYDSMLQEKAAEYNAAVRRYNEAGNRYQSAGVISGFSGIPEFTPEKTELKPTLSAVDGPARGISDVRIQEPVQNQEKLSTLEAAGLVQATALRAAMQKSQDAFQATTGAVKSAVDFIQTPANATPEEQAKLKQQRVDVVSGILKKISPAPDVGIDAAADMLTGKTDAQLRQDQTEYMTKLGKTQIVMGAVLSGISPQAGQLLKDSGSEILVSRDFQLEGLINTETGQINRPSIYDAAAFSLAAGAAGAAVGTGAVTGISGFGNILAKSAPLAIEGDAVATGYAGSAGGQALINAAAAEKTAQTALAGASALGISLSEVDYGIGDVLDQYPRRDEDRTVNNPMPGEVGIGRGILDEYPGRDQYGNRNRNQYNRNNSNRNQDWNRSELDYRGSVGSGYSTRLVEDSVLRTRNREETRNRYRYEYEYDHVTEAAPRSRRSISWQEEEESVIAQPRRKQKGRKKHFTERLVL